MRMRRANLIWEGINNVITFWLRTSQVVTSLYILQERKASIKCQQY